MTATVLTGWGYWCLGVSHRVRFRIPGCRQQGGTLALRSKDPAMLPSGALACPAGADQLGPRRDVATCEVARGPVTCRPEPYELGVSRSDGPRKADDHEHFDRSSRLLYE